MWLFSVRFDTKEKLLYSQITQNTTDKLKDEEE
jgi:hypothetical protein